MLAQSPAAFIDALHSRGPAPDRADKMGLYGWLIGSWEMEVAFPPPADARERQTGEIHFGWVLEGRAIQDVWITPPRCGRDATYRHRQNQPSSDSTARRYAFTIPASIPGTSCGSTR